MRKVEEMIEQLSNEDLVFEIYDDLLNLSNFAENLNSLSSEQSNLLLVCFLEMEVNNGGFEQYYFNSSGNFTMKTLKSLSSLGAESTKNILVKANSVWPKSTVPEIRAERHIFLENLKSDVEDIWEKCDDQFYEYEDNLTELLADYIKSNINKF